MAGEIERAERLVRFDGRMSSKEFGDMLFVDFAFFSETIILHEAQERKEALKAAAFTAWLLTDNRKSFTEYLNALGLGDKREPVPEEHIEIVAKRNVTLAERIMDADGRTI